jgi:hypothetical protein
MIHQPGMHFLKNFLARLNSFFPNSYERKCCRTCVAAASNYCNARKVKKLKRPRRQSKIGIRYDEQEVGATAGVRYGFGEPGAAVAE